MFGDCIVTGGAGFIGCAISSMLADRCRRVVSIDNLHPQVHADGKRPDRLDSRVALLQLDVTEADSWERALSEYTPEVIIHLAAETGTAQSLTEASRHGMVNVVGTTRMLDALAANGQKPKRILLASSRAVYGEGRWRDDAGNYTYPGQRDAAQLARSEWDFRGLTSTPFDALTTEPRPTSVYGATKLAQEHLLATWCRAQGVEAIILRLQNVIGSGQSLFNTYTGIVVLFCRLARAGKIIPLYEDGLITRDFIDVRDVVSAIRAALSRPANSPSLDLPLDVGSGIPRTIAELAGFISAHYRSPSSVVTGAYRQGDVRHAVCDISRTCDVLDWSPCHQFTETLDQICDWTDVMCAHD